MGNALQYLCRHTAWDKLNHSRCKWHIQSTRSTPFLNICPRSADTSKADRILQGIIRNEYDDRTHSSLASLIVVQRPLRWESRLTTSSHCRIPPALVRPSSVVLSDGRCTDQSDISVDPIYVRNSHRRWGTGSIDTVRIEQGLLQ